MSDGKEYSANANTFSIKINPVNDLPAGTDNAVSIAEDTAYTFKVEDFKFNDVDAGDTLTKIQITQSASAGTLKLDGVKIDGTGTEISLAAIQAGKLTFTPDKDANSTTGYSDFRFKVSDGQGYSSGDYTMTLNVTPVNDLPTSSDNSVKIEESQSYTFKVDDFKFEDVDQGDTLSKIQITQSVSAGTLKLNGAAIGVNTEITVADIQAGRLVFTPDANASGVPYSTFQFKVNDATGYSTDSYTMSVNVSSVNYTPTASDNTVTTVEDSVYTFKLEDFKFQDTDGDALSKIQIVQLQTAGTLKLNGVEINRCNYRCYSRGYSCRQAYIYSPDRCER